MAKARAKHLWLIHMSNLPPDTGIWVLASAKLESAVKKFTRMRTLDDGTELPKQRLVKDITYHGTIDKF